MKILISLDSMSRLIFRSSLVLALVYFQVFNIIGCKAESKEQTSKEDGKAKSNHSQQKIELGTSNTRRDPPSRERTNSDFPEQNDAFGTLIKQNRNDLTSLIDYCSESVPDSQKASFLERVSAVAGGDKDFKFLAQILQFSPGGIKIASIQEFCRQMRSVEDIQEVFGHVTNELLPEEISALWNGLAGPIGRLKGEEISNLYQSAKTPDIYKEKIEFLIGANFAKLQPSAALALTSNYSEPARARIESVFWNQFSVSDPEAARKALDQGIVSDGSKVRVSQRVINQIIKQTSLESSLEYALASNDPHLQNAMSNQIFNIWMKNDSVAASKRAAALPPGPALNGAADAIALRLQLLGDVEGAKKWKSAKR